MTIAPRSPSAAFGFSPSTIKDRGWYLSNRILIGEKWQAMAGVRSSRYESVTTTTRYDANEIHPLLSLMYKPVSNVSLYASYLEGVEESGQAPSNRANAGELLPPAVAKQKEIGVKAEIAQGVLLQAAYFDIKRPSTTVDSFNRFVLNGLARYKGVELAATGEMTKQLSLIASALFLDANQLNEANTATFGKTPDNTPERTASLFMEYRLQSVRGLALSGGLFYVGKRPVNNENQAVVDNLTNKNYWSTAGNGFLGVGAPRTLKITAKIEF